MGYPPNLNWLAGLLLSTVALEKDTPFEKAFLGHNI